MPFRSMLVLFRVITLHSIFVPLPALTCFHCILTVGFSPFYAHSIAFHSTARLFYDSALYPASLLLSCLCSTLFRMLDCIIRFYLGTMGFDL